MTFWNQKSSCEVKKKTLYVLKSLKYANGLYCILMIQRRWRITYSFCVWVHLQPHPTIQAISKYVHVIFYLREWSLNLIKHHIIKARQNADYQCNVILYQCEKDMTTFPKYWNLDLIEVWLAKRVQSLSYA